MALDYRADIDGLRALAVLPVVLFHAGIPGFSGGYVGVDIFFVISGYLITRIIAAQVNEGKFSILTFYERRIRRIFPALFVMLTVVTAAGYLFFLSDDLEKLAESTVGALLSISNFVFYEETGYFDNAAILKPLLHTWSLAVEEQFYLVLPLLLLLLTKIAPRHRTIAIAVLAGASLLAALIVTPLNQPFAFYLLPTRAWELLAGSLLALQAVPAVRNGALRQMLALVGVGLVVAPVFLFDALTPFPGPGAIAPVLGAAMLIHCAPGTLVGRALGISPLRGIGLISYSLYLWHWPIIVLMSYPHQAPLGLAGAAVAVALSLGVAALSWKFVERPFRDPAEFGHRRIWGSMVAGSVSLGLFAVILVVFSGIPGRFSDEVAMFRKAGNVSPLRKLCFHNSKLPSDACRLGDQTIEPTIAVWSDSHGVELSYALGELGRSEGFSLLQIASPGCPPTLVRNTAVSSRCSSHNEAVSKYLAANKSITTVIIAASFDSPRYDKVRTFLPGLLKVVESLEKSGEDVILVGPVPRQPFDVSRKLKLAIIFGWDKPTGIASSEFLKRNKSTFDLLGQAADAGADILLPHLSLCDRLNCAIVRDSKMLYFDDNHLTLAGARLVAARIEPMLTQENVLRGRIRSY